MLTPKQEAYAQAVASGMSQADAYRSAFNVRPATKPESIQVSASKLMKDPNIAQRVIELREPAAKRAQMTLEGHLSDLKMIRDRALEAEQYAAAITAETNRGKASGFYSERVELTGKGGGPIESRLDVSVLSTEALAEIMKARDASDRG